MSYGICQLLLRVFVWVFVFPGFPGLRVLLLASLSASLCCSESVDSELRICEFTPATACVLLRVLSSSSQDSMHCTLSLTVGLCTPCQLSKLHQCNRFFFSGVTTPTLLLVRSGLHLTDAGLL